MLLPELAALDAYRLQHDWTWNLLSQDMKDAGQPIPARTLHYLCKRAHNDATLRDRTLFKIRAFLKTRKIRVVSGQDAMAGSIPTHVSRRRARASA